MLHTLLLAKSSACAGHWTAMPVACVRASAALLCQHRYPSSPHVPMHILSRTSVPVGLNLGVQLVRRGQPVALESRGGESWEVQLEGERPISIVWADARKAELLRLVHAATRQDSSRALVQCHGKKAQAWAGLWCVGTNMSARQTPCPLLVNACHRQRPFHPVHV